MSAASVANPASSRSASARSQPRAASCSASARPMPLAAPVTAAAAPRIAVMLCQLHLGDGIRSYNLVARAIIRAWAWRNQKAGSRPAVLVKGLRPSSGARAERGSTRAGSHFLDFLAFLAFFAFFAFFAFLAIASSFGLMGGNATRGMLGGGPASQYPRIRSQQIREAMPRAVTPVSLRYPQLLCVLACVTGVGASLTLTRRRAKALPRGRLAFFGGSRLLRFIKSKPQCGLRLLRSESVKPRSCILPTTNDGDRH